MRTVNAKIESAMSPTGYLSVSLDADQGLNPYTWSPPIIWSGYIGNEKVKIVQTESHGSSLDCFDWSGVPEKYYSERHGIVLAIDKALKAMD